MKDSVTYQAIVAEGRAEGEQKGRADEARRLLLRLGQAHFGAEPDARQQTTLLGIIDLDRLEDLVLRVNTCASWAELLGTPAAPPRRPRRKKS